MAARALSIRSRAFAPSRTAVRSRATRVMTSRVSGVSPSTTASELTMRYAYRPGTKGSSRLDHHTHLALHPLAFQAPSSFPAGGDFALQVQYVPNIMHCPYRDLAWHPTPTIRTPTT